MNTAPRKIIALLLFTFAAAVAAQDKQSKTLDCTPPVYTGSLFAETFAQAKITATALCDALKQQFATGEANTDFIHSQLELLVEIARNDLDKKKLADNDSYSKQFGGLSQRFTSLNLRKPVLPDFFVRRPFGGDAFTVRFNSIPKEISDIEITADPKKCNDLQQGSSCEDIFEDFAQAFNAYRTPFDKAYDNSAFLTDVTDDWDKFLKTSKSQTMLEVMLTTFFNKRHFEKNHLVGPPPYQIIALHPDLAYSHLSFAADGQNDEMGLSLEWLGINHWNGKIPFGLSVASLYVDKAGIKDVGLGLQLRVYNRYSAGWSRHGGEDVFYINLDLLKFFEDRKQKYQKYLDSYF